jgi:enoyl-CoA hydratase
MTRLQYELHGSVATITMDDGKANVIGPPMQQELREALDAAESAGVAVVLAGRPGRFSGGFDLSVVQSGEPAEFMGMFRGGFELVERMLSFPRPIVIACTGHAVAMGAFLLLAGDHRVGATGTYKVQANEVEIGLTMPYAALAIMRHRLTPSHFNRSAITAEPYTPEAAVEAGYLDRLVAPERVIDVARATAESYVTLDPVAHAATKLRARHDVLDGIRAGIDLEFPLVAA